MSFIKKKNKTKNIPIASATCVEESKMIEKPEEEWIWIEGFKGLDYQMRGYGNFQYELGKTYEENDKEIIACRSGFHLCLNLDDVMHYYDYMSNSFTNRYFKVRALVRKSDYEKYGTKDNSPSLTMRVKNTLVGYQVSTKIDKLAAKSIIILEEIPKEEIWEKYIEPNLSDFWYLTKEKYLTNCDPNRSSTWIKEILFENICGLDITSENITSMIVEKLCINVNSSNVHKTLHQVLEEIKVLKDLDCRKDMKCYLFYSMLSKHIFTY